MAVALALASGCASITGPGPVEMVPSTVIDSDRLQRPVGVAVGADRKVYVADSGSHSVKVFAPDGEYVRSWGDQGSEPDNVQ